MTIFYQRFQVRLFVLPKLNIIVSKLTSLSAQGWVVMDKDIMNSFLISILLKMLVI
jgi:hypothetical protein